MVAFSNVVGLDLQQIRQEVGFPILRENLIAEESSVGAGKDSIIMEDTKQTLGIISKKRGIINYGEVMDWMVNQFTDTNIPFKLRDSQISSKGDMYQEYLFDIGMDNPDNLGISPMVIARASYVRKPLEILFGTYRFVCSNGAIVGNTVEAITVRPNEVTALLEHSIQQEISFGIDQMTSVSRKYRSLSDESMVGYLNSSLKSKRIPFKMKKNILENLRDEGRITINLEEDGIRMTSDHFRTDYPENLYTLVDDKDAWQLYNDMTNLASHRTRNITSRSSVSLALSEVFGI